MDVARAYATATPLPDGRVLIVGGLGAINTVGGVKLPLTSIELYDPATDETCEVGQIEEPRWLHAAYATPDGRVVIAGGYTGNFGVLADNLVVLSLRAGCGRNNVASTVVGGIRGRAGHTITPLGNGAVLIAGGATVDDSVTDSMEVLWLD
jgi:hypothetical protein